MAEGYARVGLFLIGWFHELHIVRRQGKSNQSKSTGPMGLVSTSCLGPSVGPRPTMAACSSHGFPGLEVICAAQQSG